ncbi:MAG: hypothetical protein PWP21_178 [Thermosediminibacterales bacterium]|nr:hypothetical protein [Thermosediminibacterales bacterium]
MALKVGIPRALMFYDYWPLWKRFFTELGAEVVFSDPTSKKILNDGIRATVDEACLPIKIYHGHVLNLNGKVDYIFIPRLVSVKRKEYLCPKLSGLPDMIKNNINIISKTIEIDVDWSKNKKNLKKEVYRIGKIFTNNPFKIIYAYNNALKELKNYRKKLTKGFVSEDFFHQATMPQKKFVLDDCNLKIGVLGHPYLVYDSFVNMNLINKLKKMKITVLTPEMLSYDIIKNQVQKLEKPLFWSLGNRLLGNVLYYQEHQDRKLIDGIIYLVSFGCGPDSLIGELAERWIRKNSNIPFLLLTIDEHTGEAGVDTRIEAFLDMIERRKKK